MLACPAALYKIDEDGGLSFDYAGCLECGTCRILCSRTIVERWEYPQPTMGVNIGTGEDAPVAMPASTRGGMAGQYPHILLFV